MGRSCCRSPFLGHSHPFLFLLLTLLCLYLEFDLHFSRQSQYRLVPVLLRLSGSFCTNGFQRRLLTDVNSEASQRPYCRNLSGVLPAGALALPRTLTANTSLPTAARTNSGEKPTHGSLFLSREMATQDTTAPASSRPKAAAVTAI